MSDNHSSMFDRVTRRLLNVIGRGRLTTFKDDDVIQIWQISLGPKETRDKTFRVGEFGLASVPPKDTDAVCVFIAGDRSNGVIIGTNWKGRKKNMLEGEAALYDAFGKYVHLTKNGGIVIEAAGADVTVNNAATATIHASTKVVLDSPLVQCTGNFESAGYVKDSVRKMSEDRTKYNAHKHTGVTAGAGTSGVTDTPE